MELARHNRRWLQLRQPIIKWRSPLYQSVTIRLLLGFMVIVIGVLAITRFLEPSSNPFTAYTDLISGDTHDPAFWSDYETLSRAAFELACTMTLYTDHCLYKPEHGPFAAISFADVNNQSTSDIYATVRDKRFIRLDNRTILSGESGIYFSVRDHALAVGDLALLWGYPTIVQVENWFYLRWRDQRVSTLVQSSNGQYSYFLPVQYFVLSAHPNK